MVVTRIAKVDNLTLEETLRRDKHFQKHDPKGKALNMGKNYMDEKRTQFRAAACGADRLVKNGGQGEIRHDFLEAVKFSNKGNMIDRSKFRYWLQNDTQKPNQAECVEVVKTFGILDAGRQGRVNRLLHRRLLVYQETWP